MDSVNWVYKNGDKGNEYLSVVYSDNSGKQENFYPDYIISVKARYGLLKPKEALTETAIAVISIYILKKKFEELKKYLNRYNLKGGIVRYDNSSDELFICMNEYSHDIRSDNWQLLSEVLP